MYRIEPVFRGLTPYNVHDSDVDHRKDSRFWGGVCADGTYQWEQFSGAGFEEGTWTFFGDDEFTSLSTVYDTKGGEVLHKCTGAGRLSEGPGDGNYPAPAAHTCTEFDPFNLGNGGAGGGGDVDLPLCPGCASDPACPPYEPVINSPCLTTPLIACSCCDANPTQYHHYQCYDNGSGEVWNYAGDTACP